MNKEEILKLLLENPKVAVMVIKEIVSKYKPIAYDLLQEVLEVYKDYSNNTEFPAVVAQVKKNLYNAYINAGFTEDQALAFMINDNIKLMKNTSKISEVSKKIDL